MNTSTSLKVQASYADGSSNTIRPTGLVHPDGAELDDRYGPSGSIDDAASRLAALAYGGDEVTAYQDLVRRMQGCVAPLGLASTLCEEFGELASLNGEKCFCRRSERDERRKFWDGARAR